jgi:hypothetical protein
VREQQRTAGRNERDAVEQQDGQVLGADDNLLLGPVHRRGGAALEHSKYLPNVYGIVSHLTDIDTSPTGAHAG